jgi:two-component system NtrC family sensor kinase
MTSMPLTTLPPDAGLTQHRPTGAKRRNALSLRVRLAILVALSTAAVIGIESYLEIRVFESAVERDLLETARFTALAVADDFELRTDPLDVKALAADLHELVRATPTLRDLTIVQRHDDMPEVVASTSTSEHSDVLDLAARAMQRGTSEIGGATLGTESVAVPLTRAGMQAAAVATISLASMGQLRTKGRQVTLWFAPAAIALLTLLVDSLGRRFIHRPIGRIRDTMARAGTGDFSARAEVVRGDEIGSVADGLNDMLPRLEHFNVVLQERVEEATSELRIRNEELVETYQRVFVLREALARAEQMAAVGQMAASVAHQVGTPLNLISGYVQMMHEDATSDPRNERRLQIVREQIDRVAAVVRTLLDQARRESTRQTIEIGPLLSRVADVAHPTLTTSGIQLILDVASDLPPIVADAEELELAILNLVTNALDAMRDGGTLTLRARREQDDVRVEVSDTGNGITDELLPRIFQPWVTTKPTGRGTGLGLSITHDVITRHGGTITAASDPGRITTFTIILPSSNPVEILDAQSADR